MIRSALIIGSPDDQIQGVYDDMRNYRQFFESASGGCWYPSEITTLECPSSSQVKEHLAGMKRADYSIVIFAGHGYYSLARRCTMLELRKNDEIEDYALKVGAPKHTLVIDACRVVVQDKILKAAMESFAARSATPDLTASRLLFENAVRASAPGLATMYSCSLNETAGDIAGTGGRYSSSLLGASKEWAESSMRGGVLSVSDAHDRAVRPTVLHSGGRQNPVGEFPRSIPRFPFGVKA
ncbi:caspase family protein [Massilia varians]|uniref:caspase family protein n=1 Tax=Massilia varians TaxID=457921 RepID=UPI00255615CF|nr:caspase family protein [Massilia varians]